MFICQIIINTYFTTFRLMYRQKISIEFFINTWTSDTGELFDFNTKDTNEHNSFRACVYKLPIPKHVGSQHYYFIHQSISRDEKHEFLIERRKKLESRFDFKLKSARFYKIIGCFKIFLAQERPDKKRLKCFVQIIDPQIIKVSRGERDQQKVEREKPYLVVKSFTGGYPLKEGQIVKFGKTQFKIQQVFVKPSLFQIKKEEILQVTESFNESKRQRGLATEKLGEDEEKVEPSCKICYERDSPQNPLVSPCQCSGHLAYICVECLKSWLEVKLKNFKSNQNESANVYNTKELFCEICKRRLPKKIIYKGQQFILLNFMQEYVPYVSMKTVLQHQQISNEPMYVTIVQGKKTTIGRLDENGMILYQNSVSRKHAAMSLDEKKENFVVEDAGSKYGTLLYEKDAQFRIRHNLRAVEIGNTVFAFKLIQEYASQ